MKPVALLTLALAWPAHAVELRPVETADVQRFLSRHVYVAPATKAQPASARRVTGLWTLTVAGDNGRFALSLDVAPTPSCDSGLAVFYASGDATGLEPGGAQHGLFFAFSHAGRRYLADLRPQADGSLAGDVTDFATDERYSGKATRQGDSDAFTIVAAAASMNSVSLLLEDDDGGKKLFVRSPKVTTCEADVVFHRRTAEFFACYELGENGGGATAFTYSSSPLFTVVLSDLDPQRETQLWKFDEGREVRYQKQPFLLSFTSEGGSVDFFSSPYRAGP